MVEFELTVITAGSENRKIDTDNAGFLGTREQARISAAGAADRDGLRVLKIIGLIGSDRADEVGGIARLQLGAGVWQQRGGPIFVGDAEPAIGRLEADGLGVVDLFVSVFLEALIAEI